MNNTTSENDMQKLYDQTFQGIEEGSIITGEVVAIRPDSVLIDVGYKSEGILPKTEFTSRELQNLKIGDSIAVYIQEREDSEGNISLSKEKADRRKIWERIDQLFKDGKSIDGKIVGKVKGGLSVDIGIKAFLPGSQIDVRPIKDLDRLVGQTGPVKIIKMGQKKGEIVFFKRAPF